MNYLYGIFLLMLHLSTVRSQASLPLPASNQVCLIVPPDVEQCYREFQGKPIDDKAAQVNCLQRLLWNFAPDSNNTQAELDYFRSLAGDINAFTPSSILQHGNPRPPTGRRARQEYRTLTPEERQRFHAALNKLYEDGTIRAFARLHARGFRSHHNGPSFLPWHRVFLVLFEEALRRVDPRVSLPFWDSTMDNDMDNPVNSVIWKPEYFGNGIGDVVSGPAAGWVTDQGNLERNYGQESRLFSKEQIRSVLSRCELQQISQPTAEIQYDFELYHGGPHVWVGGDMSAPSTTGYDPIFYMHHAFVDYVWELFRRRQFRRCRIDPTQDYPNVAAGDSHAPESPMFGFEWLTNADGLKHYWIDNWYYYESTPSCPNCCRGCSFKAPIYCDRQQRGCVARSRRTFAFGPRGSITSPAEAFAQASLDSQEIEALTVPSPPRNRGTKFQHPPNDGRTIHTAISDAFTAFSAEDVVLQGTPGSARNGLGDRRGSLGVRGDRTNRRSIPEGWGPPPDRRTLNADGRSTTNGRGFSDSLGSSSGRRPSPNVGVSQADRLLETSGGRLLSQSRRVFADPRGSSPDRRTLANMFGSQTDRTFPDGRGSLVDRRISSERRILSDQIISGRGQISERPASFANTRDTRLPDNAVSTSERFLAPETLPSTTGGRLLPPESVGQLLQSERGLTASRERLAPSENTLTPPETGALPAGHETSVLDMSTIGASLRSPRNRGLPFAAPP